MDEIHTNEEISEVVNIGMGTLQRLPFFIRAVMVRDTNEKGSPLRCWVMIFAFSFFGIVERVVMRVTTRPVRQPMEPSGPESDTARVKGTEKSTHL
jgi:hypothetical protein